MEGIFAIFLKFDDSFANHITMQIPPKVCKTGRISGLHQRQSAQPASMVRMAISWNMKT